MRMLAARASDQTVRGTEKKQVETFIIHKSAGEMIERLIANTHEHVPTSQVRKPSENALTAVIILMYVSEKK